MVNYSFLNDEEELLHIIRTNGTTYQDYEKVVGKIQNINYTDSNDCSFLYVAVLLEKLDIAKDLLQRGINVDIQNVTGSTAIMVTESKEDWKFLREILKYHPNLNLKSDRCGDTLLHKIVRYTTNERNAIAKELVKLGANPHALNKFATSPLDLVIEKDNKELIEAFLQIKYTQEEPQPYRVPKLRNGIFPLKMSEYEKYICVKDINVDYVEAKIIDYSKIFAGKKRKYKFKITPINNSLWILLSCPTAMDFFNYHNLMSWIYGLEEDTISPTHTICISLHKAEERRSYYTIMDKQKYGDRMVGRFQNRESFSIFLPESLKKTGNAKSYRDVLPIKNISEYLSTCGFDVSWIKNASDMQAKELQVEMAVF